MTLLFKRSVYNLNYIFEYLKYLEAIAAASAMAHSNLLYSPNAEVFAMYNFMVNIKPVANMQNSADTNFLFYL